MVKKSQFSSSQSNDFRSRGMEVTRELIFIAIGCVGAVGTLMYYIITWLHNSHVR